MLLLVILLFLVYSIVYFTEVLAKSLDEKDEDIPLLNGSCNHPSFMVDYDNTMNIAGDEFTTGFMEFLIHPTLN